MSVSKLLLVCAFAITALFAGIGWSFAGETINFGIGRMLDPALNPDDSETGEHGNPMLLESQGVVYALWSEELNYSPFESRIAMNYSLDNGKTWSQRSTVLSVMTDYISTYAGTGVAGYSGDGGPAAAAQLNNPRSIKDNYIADTGNNCIRMIDGNGIITTIAGTGVAGYSGDGGLATDAQLNAPEGLYSTWNAIYIADTGNHCVRKIDLVTGIITTLAGTGEGSFSGDGGPADQAGLNTPTSLTSYYDGTMNILIADTGNRRVRMVNVNTGIITTVAGGGASNSDGIPATEADLLPVDIICDYKIPSGGTAAIHHLFISDRGTNRVRIINMDTGIIMTIAGSGGSTEYNGDGIPATQANLCDISGIYYKWADDNMLIVDSGHYRVRNVDFKTGMITTLSGNGASGYSPDGVRRADASFVYPVSVGMNEYEEKVYYVVDSEDNRVQRLRVRPPYYSSRSNFSADVDFDGKIHVVSAHLENEMGGFRHVVYDPETGAWTEMQPNIGPSWLMDFSLKVDEEGELYLMTDMLGEGTEFMHYRYERSSDTWEFLGFPPNLWYPTEDAFMFCIDKSAYQYLICRDYLGSEIIRIYRGYGNNWTELTDAGQPVVDIPVWSINHDLTVNASPDGKIDLAWAKMIDLPGYNYYKNLHFARLQGGQLVSGPVLVDRNFAGKDNSIGYPNIFYGGINENGEYDVYVEWSEYRYDYIYDCYEFNFIARSKDGGKSFGRNHRASWGDMNGECAERPTTMALEDAEGGISLVHLWKDDRNHVLPDHEGNWKIYVANGRVYDRDADVLLVDDDKSDLPPYPYNIYEATRDYYNYEAWYVDALFENEIPFDFYDLPGEQHPPSLEYLNKFDTLVWETGLEYNEDPVNPSTLSQAEQDMLAAYLDRGGKMFLCSQDFLRDVTAGIDGLVTNTFANDYLSVSAVENFFDHCDAYDGVPGDPLSGGLAVYTTDDMAYDNPITGMPYYLHHFDHINTKKLIHSADTIFTYNKNGDVGDIALRKSGDTYSLVYFGYPFETIGHSKHHPSPSSRTEVMNSVMGWLKDSQGFVLSKDPAGTTDDRFFGTSDTIYLSMWSDRIDESKCKKNNYARLNDPSGTEHLVELVFNPATGRIEGSLALAGKPLGDWTAVEMNIQENDNRKYTVPDVPFSVAAKVEALNPVHHEVPRVITYPVNVRLTGANATVSVYYYNVLTPGTLEFIDSVNVDATGGPAEASVDFVLDDYGLISGDELGIYVEATGGGATVTSRGTGTLGIK